MEKENKEKNSNDEENKFFLWNHKVLNLIWLTFMIVFVFLSLWNSEGFTQLPKAPDMGDSFNIFNALIGAITVVFVSGAYRMQYQAFQLQKDEMKKTSDALKQQEKEMQEQNRQQYIKFLLEQKNILLEKISYKHSDIAGIYQKKWFEVFEYWSNDCFWSLYHDIPFLKIQYEHKSDGKPFDKMFLFENGFYKKSSEFLKNYKNLCHYIKLELEKSENTKNLTFLAISAEEQFCFDLMDFFDKEDKKNNRTE